MTVLFLGDDDATTIRGVRSAGQARLLLPSPVADGATAFWPGLVCFIRTQVCNKHVFVCLTVGWMEEGLTG